MPTPPLLLPFLLLLLLFQLSTLLTIASLFIPPASLLSALSYSPSALLSMASSIWTMLYFSQDLHFLLTDFIILMLLFYCIFHVSFVVAVRFIMTLASAVGKSAASAYSPLPPPVTTSSPSYVSSLFTAFSPWHLSPFFFSHFHFPTLFIFYAIFF